MGCAREVIAEFMASMVDVLKLYAPTFRLRKRLVCLNEPPVRLLAPDRAGQPRRRRPGRTRRSHKAHRRLGKGSILYLNEALTAGRTLGVSGGTVSALTLRHHV